MDNTAKMFETILAVPVIDHDCIGKAKGIFEEQRKKGIILSGDFSDNHWKFSDEYSHVGLHFNINEVSYKRFYKEIFQISCDVFMEYLKTYVMLTMGELVLLTLQNIVNDIKRLVSFNPEDLFRLSEELHLVSPNRVNEFLSLLPEPHEPERVEKLMDSIGAIADIRYSESSGKQRFLASFDSYFLFNDIVNDYWKGSISEEERLFFYPLYLWWQISGVIPLRPREFILTPRNCLEKREDGYYITLRRNHLKGSDKKISYRIEEDYFTVTYRIPDSLAAEIQRYIEFTKKYESTELKTLFVTDPHYKQWGQKKHINSRYFTYINLSCVMRYFFHDVIEKQYGLKIIYDRENTYLEDGCIHYMHLGDTRHLALINIIAEGGTPVIAMMLAGHDNMEMSSHYYSNIATLIECKTYRQYKKMLKGNVSYEISGRQTFPLGIKDFTVLEDGGRCYSPNFYKGSFDDCKKIAGPEGEIGYCPLCTYYRSGKQEFFKGESLYKRKIEDDCKHLEEIVRQTRCSKGSDEDILQALIRLQSSSYSYQQYCEEKLLKGKENGTKKSN